MFTKSYKLGEVKGTDFKITLGWIILVTLFTISFSNPSNYDRYLNVLGFISPFSTPVAFPESTAGMVLFSLALMIGIYTSVILHEIGHSLAAKHYGINVKTIKLWLAGGVAEIETMPTKPAKEFTITIAGPAVTLALVPLFGLTAFAFHTINASIISWFFTLLTLFNTAMLILNLTPAFPLDGGRIFRSTLARKLSYHQSTRYATKTTLFICLVVSILAIHLSEYGYIGLSIIIGILAFVKKQHINSLYNPKGWIDDPNDFIIADQSFYLDDRICPALRSALCTAIEHQNGTVIDDPVGEADIGIVPENNKKGVSVLYKETGSKTEVIDRERDEDLPNAIVRLDTFSAYLSNHGIPVTVSTNKTPNKDLPSSPVQD